MIKLKVVWHYATIASTEIFHDKQVSVSTLRMSVTVRQSSSFHILTSFAQVDADIREDIISLLLLGNDVASAEALVADNVTLKSCSIDEMFV